MSPTSYQTAPPRSNGRYSIKLSLNGQANTALNDGLISFFTEFVHYLPIIRHTTTNILEKSVRWITFSGWDDSYLLPFLPEILSAAARCPLLLSSGAILSAM